MRLPTLLATAALAVLATGPPHPALAAPSDAKPIPGGFTFGTELFHFGGPPAANLELSTIGDFQGSIAVAHINGTGTGTDAATGVKQPLLSDLDVRIMHGDYVGMDGQPHKGTYLFL